MVSYVVMEVSTNKADKILQEVASLINLNLTEDGGDEIPYVPPIGFEQLEGINKLFLYGVSGWLKFLINNDHKV
jgi:hypothetical protein